MTGKLAIAIRPTSFYSIVDTYFDGESPIYEANEDLTHITEAEEYEYAVAPGKYFPYAKIGRRNGQLRYLFFNGAVSGDIKGFDLFDVVHGAHKKISGPFYGARYPGAPLQKIERITPPILTGWATMVSHEDQVYRYVTLDNLKSYWILVDHQDATGLEGAI